MKNYSIGLDIGTTSTKAILFNRQGHVLAESEYEYPIIQDHPSWAEQDPDQIEKAAIQSIQTVITKAGISPNELITIGMSSAMHSIICMDEDHKPLSNSITWADGRSTKQAERFKENGGLDLYLNTGTPIHPMSPFMKLVWMKENLYEPYLQAKKFISIKEYLILKWFGEYVVDYSVAAATGLFNIHTHSWDEKALELAGIHEHQLSTPVQPTYILSGLDTTLAKELGVPADLPFVVGASDGPLANLGIGAINPGEVAITIGTSGAIRQMTKKPNTDKKQEIFCYSVTDDMWVMGGPTNNGGIVLRWLKEVLGGAEVERAIQEGNDPYTLLTTLAEKSSPGAEGLLFLPYLNGERAPFWDANARGSYFGLTLSHRKEHMIRAGLEGVIFSLYHVGEALERLADEPKKLYASGGFARSPLWLQILADVFGKEVHVPESHQSSAWGAAWLALYSLGEVQSLSEIKTSIPMKTKYVPNTKNHQYYRDLYSIFSELYEATRHQSYKLAQIQKSGK